MKFIFERLEKGITKNKRDGGTYKVNAIHGKKLYNGEQIDYTKEYFGSNDDLNAVFDSINPGTTLELSFDSSRYKNLVKAEVVDAGSNQQAPPPSKQQQQAKPQSSGGKSAQFRDPDEIIRTDALEIAQKMVLTGMEQSESFKSLLKKSSTFDSLSEEIIGIADKYTKFIKGELGDPESTDSDLNREEKDTEQPEIPE